MSSSSSFRFPPVNVSVEEIEYDSEEHDHEQLTPQYSPQDLKKLYNEDSVDASRSTSFVLPRTPTFHASSTAGIWQTVLSYEACVRLCINAWSRGCSKTQIFLDKECDLLRNAFGLQKILLQPEEELLTNNHSPLLNQEIESSRTATKIRVQVRKVKVIPDKSDNFGICSPLASKVESAIHQFCSSMHSPLSLNCKSDNAQYGPKASEGGSSSYLRSKYFKQMAKYIKQMLKSMKSDRSGNSSPLNLKVQKENYSCKLRPKSHVEMDAIQILPGSSESYQFLLESPADDLMIEVLDSKGKTFGSVVAQVTAMLEDSGDRCIWCPIYQDPDHKLVGKLQLHVTSTNHDENSTMKCGSVAETLAYDLLMETAMKEQHFHQRNLLLNESWAWLLGEFASYYGVSEIYTKLRYVSNIMEVATPTSYCLNLVHELLLPVYKKGQKKETLSCQENRMLRNIEDQLERVLGLVFQNYKSLDESTSSGIVNFLVPVSRLPAPALEPALELYKLLHNISSPEVQTNLCRYFQAAVRKISRRHIADIDEYVQCDRGDEIFLNSANLHVAYQKMKTVCLSISNEIYADIQIQNHNIIPSFVDLPNLSASIYSTELSKSLCSFLVACPPPGPSTPVAELVTAVSNIERNITDWGIRDIKGGVDSRELFHPYIVSWIQNTRNSLLTSCKLEKVKWAGVKTHHATTPFLDETYRQLMKILYDFEVIISLWPDYILPVENAIADVEKAIEASLEVQYAGDLVPLVEIINPRRISLKYIQKLSQRSVCSYTVSDDLGILMNSLKRMLDVLHPEVEAQVKLWTSCLALACNGSTTPGDRLSEITVLLRVKFRDYTKAIAELLAANTRLQKTTKLKTILQESKNHTECSAITSRMQPLITLLAETVAHLNEVFETRVFIQVCRVFWNRMGQEVQSFLDTKRETESWYKGSRIIISALDDFFVTQMRHLHADSIKLKDLEAPQAVVEVHSMLSKEHKGGI